MKVITKAATIFIAALTIIPTINTALAQGSYPDRAVHVVLGYPPAGPVDILARIMSDKLAAIWGQPAVVENVSGAAGNIGGDRVAKAAPDGYTLLMATNAQLAVNPSLYKKMTYDPAKDLAPISLAVYSPNILVVPNDVPAKTVAELVAYARANPGKLTFGSAGVGTTQHLAGELFKSMAQDRYPARALSRRRAGYHRSAGRTPHHVLRRHLAFDSVGAGRQSARARRHIGRALRRRCPICRP